MTQAGPQIGFDRFIHRDWVSAALRVRAGLSEIQDLNELIASSHSGDAAKKKTRTVLNRLWLEPRPELVEFADRGVQIYREAPDTSVAVLGWGMAIATYPFFGKVAEIVGRLTALQGDCASAEVHRRMSEIFGEREGTRRMTNMVLQSQASWGAIERVENGKRLVRKPRIDVGGALPTAWLVEACLHYLSRPISLPSLESHSVIFPFKMIDQLPYFLSTTPSLEVRNEGYNQPIVDLKRKHSA
jgi:hypothetical protein